MLLMIISVIFSYWTKMLDLIQQALESHGFVFQRIDGKTSLEERSDAIRQFNEDFNCTILLASIGSAGEG
jgi:SNF2 family DNA or RNA helicase